MVGWFAFFVGNYAYSPDPHLWFSSYVSEIISFSVFFIGGLLVCSSLFFAGKIFPESRAASFVTVLICIFPIVALYLLGMYSIHAYR